MSVNEKKAGSTVVTYVLEISNGDKAEIVIHSTNATEKSVYLKHFLEVNRDQDVFFIDNLTGVLYNKNHIVKCEEKKD